MTAKNLPSIGPMLSKRSSLPPGVGTVRGEAVKQAESYAEEVDPLFGLVALRIVPAEFRSVVYPHLYPQSRGSSGPGGGGVKKCKNDWINTIAFASLELSEVLPICLLSPRLWGTNRGSILPLRLIKDELRFELRFQPEEAGILVVEKERRNTTVIIFGAKLVSDSAMKTLAPLELKPDRYS
jgi:hypothetical protein